MSSSHLGRRSRMSEQRSEGRSNRDSIASQLHSPDLDVEEISGTMHSLHTSVRNFLKLLRDPVDQLEVVLQDVVDYELGALSASTTAWKVSEWLDEDPPIAEQIQALTSIRNLAQTQACRLGMLSCPKLVRKLIEILRTTTSTELRSLSASCIQLMVKTNAGARSLLSEFGIPRLVELLRDSSEHIVTTALYVLNQLMWHLPAEARPEVRACSAQRQMAMLLADGRLKESNAIIYCVDSIRMAVYRCAEAKLTLVDTNIHADLIRLLRTYVNQPKVVYNITRLIKVLSTCPESKQKLVSSGAVEALTLLLHTDHEFLQLEALWSLRNLSDCAYHLNTMRDLIMRLSELLASRDENISICSIGCLCNLTCRNGYNKGLLVETGGVARLCQLLNLNPQRQEITEPICSALRHATHRSPHAEAAIFEIRSSQALSSIAALLQHDDCTTALPLIKAVVGLIRNVASDDESRIILKSYGVVRSLARVLQEACNTVHTLQPAGAAPGPALNFNTAGAIEGVRLEDMVELCLIALHSMAKDGDARDELVHTAGLVVCVVQLLYASSEVVQRAAVCLLNQLTVDQQGVQSVERAGACARLTELIQSNNEHIAAYSAAVLHRITLHKPPEYRQRVLAELRQALFDGGLVTADQQAAMSHEQHFAADELIRQLEQAERRPSTTTTNVRRHSRSSKRTTDLDNFYEQPRQMLGS